MQPDVDALADLVLDTIETALGPILERLAVIEARPAARDGRDGLPGVPGGPGEKGLNGLNGRDGVDGLGFDDLDLVIDDARKGCFLRFTRGDRVKEFRLPIPLDMGPYHDGEHYEKGNEVSWSGALWIAKAPTTDKPGEGATAWRLAVKKAKNGNDGKDGQPGPPGPRGPGWEETMDERRRR